MISPSKMVPYVDLLLHKKPQSASTSPRKVQRLDYVDIVPPQTKKRRLNSPEDELSRVQLYDSTGDDSEWAQLDGEILMDHDESVPVRVIDDFTVFNSETGRMASMQEIDSMSSSDFKHQNLVVAGDVTPYVEDDSDLDDDPDELSSVRMRTTRILEYNSMHLNDAQRFDPKLYLRTEFAWYILNTPSSLYAPFSRPLLLQHTALHSVLSAAIDDEFISFESFITSLSLIPDLGRRLDKKDFEDADLKLYLSQRIALLCHKHKLRHLKDVPLINTLLKGSDQWESRSDISSDGFCSSSPSATTSTSTSTSTSRQGFSRRKKMSAQQLANQFIPNATPTVREIVSDFFRQDIALCGDPKADEDDVDESIHTAEHLCDPEKIEWSNWDEKLCTFCTVILDGTEYHVGDAVIVEPGLDEDEWRHSISQKDASKTRNKIASCFWFCRIWSFSKKEGTFHAQWYTHGSKTILQETAHSTGLFRIEDCEDIPVKSIVRKCEVRLMGTKELDEPKDEKDPEAANFHCSYVWDPDQCSLVDIPTSEEMATLIADTNQLCYNCAQNEHKRHYEEAKIVDNDPGNAHLELHDVVYHVHDCVYVRPPSDSKILKIAQITSIGFEQDRDCRPRVLCRYFQRYSDHSEDSQCQERRLILLKDSASELPASSIDGKCFVLHSESIDSLSDWTEHPDHWYVKDVLRKGQLRPIPPKTVTSCSLCLSKNQESLLERKRFKERMGPLRGMELFAGAGGLSAGFEMSGHVHTAWAMEWDQRASETFRINHPKCQVFNQDVNVLLEQAKEVTSDASKHLPTKGSTLPRKGEVDFIFGGPPCQAYSGANHNKNPDDIRATLPMTMLSFVELYRPKYFLLENVPGLVSFPLLSVKVTDYKLHGGIKTGMVKIIVRVLIALGYQVRFKILQAGQYGSPQGRRRIIFWGALRGLRLPEFPIPTHAFPLGNASTSVPALDHRVPPPTRARDDAGHQCAPLAPITVNDAISDLPPFEWINPHRIIPRKSRHASPSDAPQFNAIVTETKAFPGYPEGKQHSSPPQNEYQRWVRHGVDDIVTGHYTACHSAAVVEATMTVPLRPNACHRDIPEKLLMNCARTGGKQRNKIFYGRLDGDGAFKTALTSAEPNKKGAYTIHPTQRRTISIREAARSQGFPDRYIFVGSPQEQYKQIGNAVPVPLGLALGRALGEARFLSNSEVRESSPEL